MYRFLTRIVLVAFGIAGSVCSLADTTTPGACSISKAEIGAVLALSYQDFDQNPRKGWRPYYRRECYDQARDLLLAYLAQHPDVADEHYMLRFHVGQLLAMTGEYEEAKQFMRKAYTDFEAPAIDWNAFVDANIAFLDKDKGRLLEMRSRIASQPKLEAGPGVPSWAVGRIMNLDVVDGFIACFDEPYVVAYGDQCRARKR
jgi:tetratricopeptide (TPR) repeat protein